jgi:hypothetical protein
VPYPELLDEAVAAHGGEAYDAAAEIEVDVSCSGWAFVLKRQRGAFDGFTGTVSTAEPRVILDPYREPGRRGVLEHGNVRIEDEDGQTVLERENPRSYFKGRRNLWWDDLDLLYFGGYALWGYINAPFIFRSPDYEVEEIEPWQENGEAWRGLRVRFPDDVPAHSREQRYYFGADGLLRRNDYTAEVFGGWAKATHYCWEHETFSGLTMPTHRKALPRLPNGKPLRQFALVEINIGDVRLRPRVPEAAASGTP